LFHSFLLENKYSFFVGFVIWLFGVFGKSFPQEFNQLNWVQYFFLPAL